MDQQNADMVYMIAEPIVAIDENGVKYKCKGERHLKEYQWMFMIDIEGKIIKRAISIESLLEIN